MSAVLDYVLQTFGVCDELKINYNQIDGIVQHSSKINIDNREVINFGNCSYLGLDHNQTVRDHIASKVMEYGGIYSASRAFGSIKYLSQVEEKISTLFQREALLSTTTGLSHIGLIPMLTSKKDLIIHDRQVHKTVQNGILIAKGQGASIIASEHNATDQIVSLIEENKGKYEKIWLMIDSIYSMYGDIAPLEFYASLLDKFDNFYLYIDDAHGMSWVGENGTGLMLSRISWHEKLFMTTSLAKGFGANGGACLLPSKEFKKVAKYLASHVVFSGPLPPPSLAAIDRCADIHLNGEIHKYQEKLMNIIGYFRKQCNAYNVSLVSESPSPVNFIQIGKSEDTIKKARKILENGVLVNPCDFPAVPRNKSGLRITLNALLDKKEIDLLIQLVDNH